MIWNSIEAPYQRTNKGKKAGKARQKERQRRKLRGGGDNLQGPEQRRF